MSVFLKAVIAKLWGVAHSIAAFVWNLFQKQPLTAMLAILVFAACLLLAGALLLRRFRPRRHLTIAPFSIPRGEPKFPITGRTIANILADELLTATKKALGWDFDLASRVGFGGPPLSVLARRESSSVGVEFKGVSVERIRSEWGRLREMTAVVHGDVLPAGSSWVLAARVFGQWAWAVDCLVANEDGLRTACRLLALQILPDYSPSIAGLYYLQNKDVDRAIALLKTARRAEPNKYRPVSALADALSRAGRHDDARQVLLQFKVSWYRRRMRATQLNGLGVTHMREGELERSLELFDRALKADKTYVLPRANRAVALGRLGRNPEALAEVEKIKRLDPFNRVIDQLEKHLHERPPKA